MSRLFIYLHKILNRCFRNVDQRGSQVCTLVHRTTCIYQKQYYRHLIAKALNFNSTLIPEAQRAAILQNSCIFRPYIAVSQPGLAAEISS